MQELVGLEDVKRQVLNVVNAMKYNRIREKMGISGNCYHNVHVMLGAPGTAKTTVAQLIIELENHSADKLIIFAGYGGKKVNEKNNEMVQILFKIAENNHYRLDETIREMLRPYFQKRMKDDNFGNGREARSLLETAVIYTAERVLAQKKKAYTRAEMQTIAYEDVEKAVAQSEYALSVQNACQVSGAIGFTAS